MFRTALLLFKFPPLRLVRDYREAKNLHRAFLDDLVASWKHEGRYSEEEDKRINLLKKYFQELSSKNVFQQATWRINEEWGTIMPKNVYAKIAHNFWDLTRALTALILSELDSIKSELRRLESEYHKEKADLKKMPRGKKIKRIDRKSLNMLRELHALLDDIYTRLKHLERRIYDNLDSGSLNLKWLDKKLNEVYAKIDHKNEIINELKDLIGYELKATYEWEHIIPQYFAHV